MGVSLYSFIPCKFLLLPYVLFHSMQVLIFFHSMQILITTLYFFLPCKSLYSFMPCQSLLLPYNLSFHASPYCCLILIPCKSLILRYILSFYIQFNHASLRIYRRPYKDLSTQFWSRLSMKSHPKESNPAPILATYKYKTDF